MIEESLHKIGFTDGETRIYLALLELGSSATGKITEKSGISGSKVYEVLDRLVKKGVVSAVTKNGVKYFEAASPSRILDYLEQKKLDIEDEKQVVEKIIPQLLLKQANTAKSEAKIFTGFEGLKTVTQDILDSLRKNEEWLSMGLTEQPKTWEAYFNKKQKERARKGIVLKQLVNERYAELREFREKLAHTTIKFLPENFEMPTSTEVYANKVAIFILLKETPMAIVIENKPVAESFRKYFNHIWNTAKKAK